MLFYWVYVFSINLEQSIEALILLRKQNLKAITKTSLVVQWLRLQAPNAGSPRSILGQGTRSHMLQLIPAAAAKSLQLCPTLCDPRDGSPPGSPVPGILQARILEWVSICMKMKTESEVAQLCPTLVTPWIAGYQAPPSMGFSRQEHWSGVPLPSPTYRHSQVKNF